MDIMIPYLGRITRLSIETKGAFQTQPSTHKKSVNKGDDGIEHLDTWA